MFQKKQHFNSLGLTSLAYFFKIENNLFRLASSIPSQIDSSTRFWIQKHLESKVAIFWVYFCTKCKVVLTSEWLKNTPALFNYYFPVNDAKIKLIS